MTSHIFRLGLTGAVLFSLAACGGSSGSSGRGIDPDNQAPVISGFNAPASIQARQEAVPVSVIASDPEGDPLTFSWTQASGPVVILRGTDTATVTFDGPPESAAGAAIVLRVVVSDPNKDTSATVTINVADLEFARPPEVDAGDDQIVNAGDDVMLAGSATDPDPGDELSFQWSQVDNGAPSVGEIINADEANARFEAPAVSNDPIDLVFELAVTDLGDNTETDRVTISVLPLPRAAGPADVFVSQNGPDTENMVRKFVESPVGSQMLIPDLIFTSIDNEGLALDILGNAMHVGDDDAPNNEPGDIPSDLSGGLSFICRIGGRITDNAFDHNGIDRDIRGARNSDGDLVNNPGMDREPGAKGVTIAHEAGYVIIADFNDQQIKVYGTEAEGNVAPLRVITLGAKPWDVAYDPGTDTLFAAATNGTVRVLDNFVAQIDAGGTPSESRQLTVVNANGVKISRNLHGIDYAPAGDRLVLTDVGTTSGAQAAQDGTIYVLNAVAQQNGNIVAAKVIEGPQTGLGNPVDIVLWGRDVLVAEKANDQLLLFRDIFTAPDGDVSPTGFPVDKPESVALAPKDLERPANGAAMPPGGSELAGILLTVDDGNGLKVLRLNPALGDQPTPPAFVDENAKAHSRGIAVDARGDVFVVSHGDTGTLPPTVAESRINFISRLAKARTGGFDEPRGPSATRDRSTNYNNPLGAPLSGDAAISEAVAVAVDERDGLVFILDNAPPSGADGAVHVISTCGTGSILGTAEIDPDGDNDDASAPTDIDFDPVTGDLYVSMDNGNIAVFRNFRLRFQDSPEPIVVRVQTLDDGTPVPAAEELQSIDFVTGANALILADVGGSTGEDTDGQLLIIRNAGAMGTAVLVDSIIRGAGTTLADPVDIVFDGSGLFVLDTGQMRLKRFANILQVPNGVSSPAPSGPFTPVGEYGGTPHSIALVPVGVSSNPQALLPD